MRGEVNEDDVGEQVRTSFEIARRTAGKASEVIDFALNDLNNELNCALVVGSMIVEDQIAIDTSKALLVFLDERGRAVRYTREGDDDDNSYLRPIREKVFKGLTLFVRSGTRERSLMAGIGDMLLLEKTIRMEEIGNLLVWE